MFLDTPIWYVWLPDRLNNKSLKVAGIQLSGLMRTINDINKYTLSKLI